MSLIFFILSSTLFCGLTFDSGSDGFESYFRRNLGRDCARRTFCFQYIKCEALYPNVQGKLVISCNSVGWITSEHISQFIVVPAKKLNQARKYSYVQALWTPWSQTLRCLREGHEWNAIGTDQPVDVVDEYVMLWCSSTAREMSGSIWR